MCRVPAELSIQSSIAGVRKGKKVARLWEINLPVCLSPQSHLTETAKPPHPPLVEFSMSLSLSFWNFSATRISVALAPLGVAVCHCLRCLHHPVTELAAHASSSSPAIRAKMLSRSSSMIISCSTDMRIPLHLPPIPWWFFVWTV